ncbi:MAG: cryptochrome/photolyase family protein [Acidimicrobiales bacterium]
MTVAVVVFTRDLRVRDHPALSAAVASADRIVPVFVFDDAVLARFGAPNRVRYLLDALADLDGSLRRLGGALVVRRGAWVPTVANLVAETGATAVHLGADVSALATRRLAGLRRAVGERVGVHDHPGITVVPPLAVGPASGGPGVIFTPYYKRWAVAPWRALAATPAAVRLPDGLDPGRLPGLGELTAGVPSPDVLAGGETVATERLRRWAVDHLAGYDSGRDDLAAASTSRISADVHFGCLSPLEVATRLRDRPGGEPFVRQLCWRDFYAQLLAARPQVATGDVRDARIAWVDGDEADEGFAAWAEARTGYPVVDAAMRQLRAEGFVHNRARMIVASFLCKDLAVDWRRGAAHFLDWLVDGDLASNQLNWQWTAGTGTDSNPSRIFNPTVQSTRFDPRGEYIRRWVPELGAVTGKEIHAPEPATRRRCGYPDPIVDHAEAIAAYKARNAGLR